MSYNFLTHAVSCRDIANPRDSEFAVRAAERCNGKCKPIAGLQFQHSRCTNRPAGFFNNWLGAEPAIDTSERAVIATVAAEFAYLTLESAEFTITTIDARQSTCPADAAEFADFTVNATKFTIIAIDARESTWTTVAAEFAIVTLSTAE